ncbi:N-alpha-acetyltransferase 30 [Liparis tanakae]|uniref:N-alpha-acetyltransferase 30 n=1 Tax=Liparis tanakae TaxID=230148 RepID=A0A4Z2HED5_9TELE|nr:N-alpha-acetyltransferase 30 [Liparis tanakae]
MATVPPGPSSALPASPADIPPFPGAGSADPAGEGGTPGSCREDCVLAGTGKTSVPVNEINGPVNKKQNNMLARASPAALHLKMQAREQQQSNGLAGPPEDADGHQHADDPRPAADNCDSGGEEEEEEEEEAPAARNNSERCQREGRGPFSKNGRRSPLGNNSVNGMPGYARTEAACDDDDDEGFDLTGAGPGGEDSPGDPPLPHHQPPVAELARLALGGSPGRAEEDGHGIRYVRYESELQMPWIMRLITKDLSEPYSIYTYRYFIHNWPQLCFLAMVEQECVGAIVCKLDMHKKMFRRGYIAMLAVDSKHRRKSIVNNGNDPFDRVVLETEITNKSALKLYENLGFVRDKRLFRYYLNGVDALRLKLWLR